MTHDDFRDDLPVSRGQWKALAEASLLLLDLATPATRYEATAALVRLQSTAVEHGDQGANGSEHVVDGTR